MVLNRAPLKAFLVLLALCPSSWAFAVVPVEEVPEANVGRIVNGDLAVPKQFPYQVGLSLDTERGKSWCGGVLISDRWVLTAAHCVRGVIGTEVYLGSTNRTNASEEGREVFYVDELGIHEHEAYNPSTVENDIALIQLPESVHFNEYIKPAQLPRRDEAVQTFEGQYAVASGWGHIRDDLQALTDVLRYVKVPIISNAECNQYYRGLIQPSNICIGTAETRKSVCHADSGGPLVLLDGVNNNLLIGVTSFGSNQGCEVGAPEAFTRASSYLDWIQKVTGIEIE